MALSDEPKAALQEYIEQLSTDYYTWYKRRHVAHRRFWSVGQIVVLLAGFLATAAGALATADSELSRSLPVRLVLIFLPMLGALVSALLSQTRTREMMALREQGRERIQYLVDRARVDFAAASKSGQADKLTEIHRALVEDVSLLEKEQGRIYFLTVAEGSNRATGAPPAIGRQGRGEEPPQLT